MAEAYCYWHDKPVKDVFEYEQGECEDNGCNCDECPYFVERDQEEI